MDKQLANTQAAANDMAQQLKQALPHAGGLFWGGQWHVPEGIRQQASLNPSNGEFLGDYFCAGKEEVDAAVTAASKARKSWAKTPPLERGRLLRECARRIREHAFELALIDAADCGNPVKAMQMDAQIAATQLEYFAGLVLELKGETIPTGDGSLNYTVREPVGVVVRIFPFNHPFMFAACKIAAPLAAGNTLVIKPSEQAPLSTIRLMELLADVFPPGVLNCVTGDRDTGAALACHPDVAAVALIGSVPAGKAVLHAAADSMKRTLLELGGKNAMIIFPDCDFDKAVDGAIRGMNFTWCGQSCGSTSRLFIHSSIHDRFISRLKERLPELHRPGIATDMQTTMGALVNQSQYDRSMRYIASAKAEGATLVCGGVHPSDPSLASGFFIEPTVFVDVQPEMAIAREEIFGPVLSVFRWDEHDALIDMVNAVDVGLTCSIWTRDLITAHVTAGEVDAGYIWINECSVHIPGAPFGGYKLSGMGREECKEEMFEFTHIKNINVSMGGAR